MHSDTQSIMLTSFAARFTRGLGNAFKVQTHLNSALAFTFLQALSVLPCTDNEQNFPARKGHLDRLSSPPPSLISRFAWLNIWLYHTHLTSDYNLKVGE